MTERKEKLNQIPTANLQFSIEPTKIPWIYATLRNQPEVELYNGNFPEPFEKLTYVLRHNQNQLTLASTFKIGEDFKARCGETVGSPKDLGSFFKHYPKHEMSPDGTQLAVFDKEGQIQSVIARTENEIIIQRGGGIGQLTLSQENCNPINNLSVLLDNFNLLTQRYVNSIWQSSPETDKKKLRLILDIPAIPEGAPRTYFSTFEIIAKEFQGNSRPVELDEHIGGYPKVKTAIKNLFLDQTQPEISRSYGLPPYANKFLLVTGSEGTGKSLFPKALDKMLKDHYRGKFEHYRLPFADMLRKYGSFAAAATTTILEHIRENEKNHIATLLHMDGLEHLIPQYQRPKEVNPNLVNSDLIYYQSQTPPSDAEYSFTIQTLGPLIEVIRQFGMDVGANSQNVIVYGESRLPREFLPEGITRTFRRTFNVDKPTLADVRDILRVQINLTKGIAQSTGRNPFAEDIESCLNEIANHALGLNGRSIQQALVSIANSKNAEGVGSRITHEDICCELDNTKLAKNIVTNGPESRRIGFNLPCWNK